MIPCGREPTLNSLLEASFLTPLYVPLDTDLKPSRDYALAITISPRVEIYALLFTRRICFNEHASWPAPRVQDDLKRLPRLVPWQHFRWKLDRSPSPYARGCSWILNVGSCFSFLALLGKITKKKKERREVQLFEIESRWTFMNISKLASLLTSNRHNSSNVTWISWMLIDRSYLM